MSVLIRVDRSLSTRLRKGTFLHNVKRKVTMNSRAHRRSARSYLILGILLLIGSCAEEPTSPVEAPRVQSRNLHLAIPGETGAQILINSGVLSNKSLARRLR